MLVFDLLIPWVESPTFSLKINISIFFSFLIISVHPCKYTHDYPNLEAHFRRCLPPYSSSAEYTTEYNMPGWVPVHNKSVFHTTFDLKRACPKPWRYRTEGELNTLPYRGKLNLLLASLNSFIGEPVNTFSSSMEHLQEYRYSHL